MKTLLLLGGTDEENGDYSLLRMAVGVAARGMAYPLSVAFFVLVHVLMGPVLASESWRAAMAWYTVLPIFWVACQHSRRTHAALLATKYSRRIHA